MKITLLTFTLAIIGLSNIATAQWVQTTLTGKEINCITSDGTNIFAGTNINGAYLSTNNGSTWAPVGAGITNPTIESLVISGTNILAGTYGGGIFKSTNNGGSWTAANTGMTATQVFQFLINGNTIYAGTNKGVFFTTNDGGSWTAINTGMTTTLVTALAVKSGNIFAGTQGSGVMMSSDNGTSWTSANTGLANTNISSFVVSGTNIFVGTQGGGAVYLSSDNASTWTAVNTGIVSPFYGVMDLLMTGSNLFAFNYLAKVYLTTDNGTTWTDVSTGIPSSTSGRSLGISGSTIFAGTSDLGVWKRALNEVVSIAENTVDSKFAIYPNPSTGKFKIETNNKTTDKLGLEVYNLLGEIVYSSNFKQQISTEIDLSNSPKGIYFVKIVDGTNTCSKKIIVE